MKKNPLNYRRQTSSKKQKFLINKVGNQSSSLMTRDVSFALTPGAVQVPHSTTWQALEWGHGNMQPEI